MPGWDGWRHLLCPAQNKLAVGGVEVLDAGFVDGEGRVFVEHAEREELVLDRDGVV